MSDLQKLLKTRFDPALAGDLDASIEFNWSTGSTRVAIHDGEATYCESPCTGNSALSAQPQNAPELVIYFRDEAQAMAIISGQGSPIEAFMRGEFRSNGHLVWVFQTLAAFSRPIE